MRTPGPDHPITVAPQPGRLRVSRHGVALADTTKALMLREAAYPAVLYVPREDSDMTLLQATRRHSHCPYKGDASYFTILVDGTAAENAVWSYEEPYPAVREIAGHLAFYPQEVTFETL